MNPLDMTYQKARDNASALKALGQTTVHLYGSPPDAPWHLATACEAGGMHRLDLEVSAKFSGQEDGITYAWYFDIEGRDANGRGHYRFDIEGIKGVLAKLKGSARVQFREYLADCAVKVKAKGDEYQQIADKQYRDAAVLRDPVNS